MDSQSQSQELDLAAFVDSMDENLSHLLAQALQANNQNLWELLCHQIEKENLKMKSNCIKLVEILLSHDVWPEAEWAIFLMDRLFAVYEWWINDGNVPEQMRDELLATGFHLSALISTIGDVCRSDYDRLQRTCLPDIELTNLTEWFSRAMGIITHENFDGIPFSAHRGILDFILGICRLMSLFDYDDLICLGSEIATAIKQFCSCSFFKSGEQGHICQLLGAFVDVSVKFSHTDDKEFFTWLGKMCKGDIDDSETRAAALSLLADGIPFDDNIVSKLSLLLLNAVAELRGITIKREYTEYAGPIVRRIIRRLIHHMEKIDGNVEATVRCCFENAASLFGYSWIRWLNRNLAYIIPQLMLRPSQASSMIFREIGKLCNVYGQDLIMQNIQHILVQLATKNRMSSLDEQSIYTFIENQGANEKKKRTMNEFIASALFPCICELLMNLAANKEKVIDWIQRISRLRSTICNIDGVQQMIQGLQKEFGLLGILLKFRQKFIASRISLDEKLLTLRSLIPLMEMCAGEAIGEVSSTMMSTLRAAATVDNARMKLHLATAWKVFLTSVPPATLQAVALPVFVAITPYLSNQLEGDTKQAVESILKYIFQDQSNHLKHQIAGFGYLSKTISSAVLEAYSSVMHDSTNSVNDLLKIGLKLLDMENPDIKRLTLERLKMILRTQSSSVYNLVLNSSSADDIICQLARALTAYLHHSDMSIRRLAAVCMGDMGAVDPGRLHSSVQQSSGAFLDYENIQAHEFPCGLLREVVRLLLGASDELYEICSLALQEILKFYECRDNSAIWSNLDESTKKILKPFFSTRYTIGPPNLDSDSPEEPLFGSTDGYNFVQWLTAWISVLISQVTDTRAKSLFLVLREIAIRDVNFAQFLLPHVVLRRLLEGNQQEHTQILNEMLAAMTGVDRTGESVNDIQFERCAAHVVFCVLDYLYKWMMKMKEANSSAPTISSLTPVTIPATIAIIESFLNSIPKETASTRAATFGAFPRALKYYENFLEGKVASRKQRSHESFVEAFMEAMTTEAEYCDYMRYLQELYAKLDDVDGVVGAVVVLKKSGHSADKEQVQALEATGNYTEVLPFWEAAASAEHGTSEEHLHSHLRLINCLLRLNQTNVCERYLSDLSRTNPDQDSQLHPYRVEALLKLQQWSSLEQELGNHTDAPHSWPTDVGKLLVAARAQNQAVFHDTMTTAVDHVLENLSVAARDCGTIDGGYAYKLRLHMLSEIEQGAEQLFSGKSLDDELLEWDERFKIVQPSTETLFPLLDLRKQILRLGPPSEKSEKAVGACWVEAARIARKSGHYQSAWSLLVKAKGFNLKDTLIEEAKLLWSKDEKTAAVNCLKVEVNRNYSDLLSNPDFSKVPSERKFSFAKAALLYANYCRESAILDERTISRMYQTVVQARPNWEKAYYYAALHYEQVYQGKHSISGYANIMEALVHSLEFGSRFVHYSMPRLLTVWLDSTQMCYTNASKYREQSQQYVNSISQLNRIVDRAFRRIPIYQFYCCFSQLISRICHPCESTFVVLKEILAKLISQYPKQCVWMTMSVSRSSILERSRRCREVIQRAVEENPAVEKIFADVDKLTELLICVCNKVPESPAITMLSMKRDFKQLCNFRGGENIILPLQKFMDITYPVSSADGTQKAAHKPFSDQPVYIHTFLDDIEMFCTLQRPKKISLRGSDGQTYSMLCKARDDLRLDKRLMEFTNLVNSCILRDPEARGRNLRIRTYTVTPLNEKCGLLEWVPGLDAMRNVYLRLYREQGKKYPDLKTLQCKATDTIEKKLKIFEQELLPKFPSLFKNWFPRTFPDPVMWYTARTNFIRTAAVMSMVGFVLGLGDRHGENILLDKTCGDVVHVDFNCLFNRGELLEYPEVVPFRLTRNLVDAMGPLGYEGPFRKACEVTMKLMREEAKMLRTVLETFLHDPLVEWQQRSNSKNSHLDKAQPKLRPESGEEKAKVHLNNIAFRLSGRVKGGLREEYGLPLSVEGQVKTLIEQATNNRNLAQMYLGWGPQI